MRRVLAAIVIVISPAVAGAEPAAVHRDLFDALGIDPLIAVMRTEGIEHSAELEADLFPGRGGRAWPEAVAEIYDPAHMRATVLAGIADGVSAAQVDRLLEFFASPRGRRIVGFEVSARQALLDADIEAAARERLAELRAEASPRITLLERFVDVNDLVESNVMGAMNSNYAFYLGLMDGGAFGGDLTEADVLDDVWAQEEQIREETDTWVFAYLAMAYQPLAREDLEAYIALSETAAGRALNRALFDGFDTMYVGVSRALGRAAARFMAGEDT